MRRLLAISLVATVLLASCEKEIVSSEDVKIPGTETRVLRIGIPDTKTSLGELDGSKRKVYWSDGDKIAVNGTPSEALSGIAEKSTEAEFTLTAAESAPYSIVYPSDIWVAKGLVNLPATQTYVAGNVADGAVPMAGYSASGLNATLSYLCAVVKVSIAKDDGAYPDTDDISTVAFAGNADEQVCGYFAVDYENGTLTDIATLASGSIGASDVVIVDPSEGKTVTVSPASPIPAESSLDVYLVVPARAYESGFSVTITDTEGHSMVKSTTSAATLEAGHIYNLTPVKFKPTGAASVINIGSAEELVTFASTYNTGELSDRELTVNLTDNITFDSTTSAAFTATGGIGSLDDGDGNPNYFHGTFNGNSKTISNYSGGAPLFAWIETSGVVRDFIIDSSCAFEFDHADMADGCFGAVAGVNKGEIDNVTVVAAVTMSDKAVTKDTYLGGIAGKVTVGKVTNSIFAGSLVLGSGYGATDKAIYIGGIAGIVSSPSGLIQESAFSGYIDNQATVTETTLDAGNPCLLIGGIVGKNSGSVTDCCAENHPTGVTVTLTDDKDHDYVGTIVTHSVSAYYYTMGGIAGLNEATIESCINNAGILNVFHANRTASDANGRYLYVGGISGINTAEASITDCLNTGAIIDRAVPKIHYVGGVVGANSGIVESSNNTIEAAIGVGTAHKSPYSARILYLGGVVGHNKSGATISDVHNEAGLTISRIEGTNVIKVHIGGVAGCTDSEINGSLNGGSIANTGSIAQSSGIAKCETPTSSNDYGLFLGGVVGYATQAVKNVFNEGAVQYTCTYVGDDTKDDDGKYLNPGGAHYVHLGGIIGKVKAASTVDVSGCVNTANVRFVASAKFSDAPQVVYDMNYLGGIAGYALNAAFKGSCANSGDIRGGDGSGNNNTGNTFWVGGIVGYLKGSSSISNCALTGEGRAYNDHWSNKGYSNYNAPMCGGIAGHVAGTKDSPIAISNCSVASTATVLGRRGNAGGIVGASQYATISDCIVPISFSGSAYCTAGIAALVNNTTISSCTYSGTTIQSSQMTVGGGIVGRLDTGSVIDGCNSYATTINKNGTAVAKVGGIAGESIAGTTIQNSHCKPGMAICSDANFSGSGNAADLTD